MQELIWQPVAYGSSYQQSSTSVAEESTGNCVVSPEVGTWCVVCC